MKFSIPEDMNVISDQNFTSVLTPLVSFLKICQGAVFEMSLLIDQSVGTFRKENIVESVKILF